MRAPVRVAVVVVLLALASIVAGCGGSKRVDVTGVERVITAKLAAAFAPARVTSTTCPGSPPLETGTTFTCSTRIDGQPVGVDVRITDTDGGITFTTTKAIIVTAHVEADLRKRLHAAYDEPGDTIAVTVRCPGPAVRVLAVGASFRCDAFAAGTAMPQRATVADRHGTIAFSALG